jgi:hypothetical protein
MTGLQMLVAAALISTISATSALAQEPDEAEAEYPNRDLLNGGGLTPAARLGLEPGGVASLYAANRAAAGFAGASPASPARRHHATRNTHLHRP